MAVADNYLSSAELEAVKTIIDTLNDLVEQTGRDVSLGKVALYDVNGERVGYAVYFNGQYVYSKSGRIS